MPDIQISLLNYADSKLIAEFYSSFYPKKGRDEAKFRWEFQHSPYQESVYVIAKDADNGKIVGSQAAIPLELVDGNGTTILTAKSEDTIVHPDYRGQNIFDNMYKLLFEECAKRGIKVIWGFTTAKKPFAKLGFETPYAISQSLACFGVAPSVKYLTEYNPAKGAKAKFKTISLCLLARMKSLQFQIGSTKVKDVEVVMTDNSVPLDNSKLIEDILSKNKNQFFLKQDEKYLKWRLTGNPYHQEFICFTFKKGSDVVASICFNHHEAGVWYLIQDIYVNELDESQKTAIIRQAISTLRKHKPVNLIRTWDFTHNQINKSNVSAKKSAGFVHLNKGSLFVWKVLDQTVKLKSEDFILSRIASEGTI